MSRRANGEGSIYKRADGRWCASVSVELGKRKSYYGATRQEVAQKMNAALKARQDGLPLPAEQQTVREYLEYWVETIKPSVRPRTYEAYDLNVRRVVPIIGKIRLARLSPTAIQSCYAKLLDGGLSKRSVEQAHTVLHLALGRAVQWGLLGRNPSDAVSVPRPGRREMKTLSAEQVDTLFTATPEDRLHGLWVLLATTGLRLGEATALTWADVDFEERRLSIHRALQRQRGVGLVFVERKTSRSRRVVHLPSRTVSALRDHRSRQLPERVALGPAWYEGDLVFCNEIGTPIDPSWVGRRFHAALEKAGLPRVRVHDLRHTAATLLLEKAVHPKVVQEMLGHSTIMLTMDTYSHVSPAMHKEAAAQMDALFALGSA